MAEKMDCSESSVKLEVPPASAGALCPVSLDPLDLFEGLPDFQDSPLGASVSAPSVAPVAGPSGSAPSVAGAPAPKPKGRIFACSACPRAFGERKRLRAHWETAHAASFDGYRCPHAGCTRAFHKEHRQHLKIHLKSGHAYSSEQVAQVLSQLTVTRVANERSDGRASQVALPADLVQPSGPRTPAKKRKAAAENRPAKAARFAVGQDVLRQVVDTMNRVHKTSTTHYDEEQAAWKQREQSLNKRIRELEAEVASLKRANQSSKRSYKNTPKRPSCPKNAPNVPLPH